MSDIRMIPISFEVGATGIETEEDVLSVGRFVVELRDEYLRREAELVPLVCGVCGHERGLYVPDACIGKLPGVAAACCGHGDADSAYVSIGMGKHHVVIHGQEAVDWMHEIREATTCA